MCVIQITWTQWFNLRKAWFVSVKICCFGHPFAVNCMFVYRFVAGVIIQARSQVKLRCKLARHCGHRKTTVPIMTTQVLDAGPGYVFYVIGFGTTLFFKPRTYSCLLLSNRTWLLICSLQVDLLVILDFESELRQRYDDKVCMYCKIF